MKVGASYVPRIPAGMWEAKVVLDQRHDYSLAHLTATFYHAIAHTRVGDSSGLLASTNLFISIHIATKMTKESEQNLDQNRTGAR